MKCLLKTCASVVGRFDFSTRSRFFWYFPASYQATVLSETKIVALHCKISVNGPEILGGSCYVKSPGVSREHQLIQMP